MENSEIVVPKKRGRPFEKGRSGNPSGKPRGTRHASTLMAEALLEGQSGALVEKLIEKALDGNVAALRLTMERLVPPRRERTLQFKLPPLETAADATAAINCIFAGLAEGELTESEAKAMVGAVEVFLKVLGQIENDRRLSALEKAIPEILSEIEMMKSQYVSGKA